MRIIRKKRDLAEFLQKLRSRDPGNNQAIENAVAGILKDVKIDGDKAVLKYTRRFDDSRAVRLSLFPSEITKFARKADPGITKALEISARRIRKFHKMQSERSWSYVEALQYSGSLSGLLKGSGSMCRGGRPPTHRPC